jgi:tetratricopeptide (TPR) repeat protein
MNDSHLTGSEIRQLIETDNTATQTKLLLHHLAVCPDCYAEGGYILDLHLAGALPERFSSVDIDLAKSRADAPGLYAKLSRFGFKRQQGLLRDTRRFRSWGLAELLCAESLTAAARDPEKAVQLAELAVLLASKLGEWEPAEEAWLCLLRSYAWAHLGNARRVLGELRSAEEAFARSSQWWEAAESMGDVLDYEAMILALKASLRRTQGRFAEALSFLDEALALPSASAIRSAILASRAFTLGEAGDLKTAAGAFREAIAATDRTGAPRLYYILHHNLLDALSKAGRIEEAASLLPEVAALARETGEEIDLLRFEWLEARIAAKAGDSGGAMERLDRVRTLLLHRGLAFDAALATLELMHLYLLEGVLDAVEALAGDLLAIFEAQGVPREALATLTVFCRAAKAKLATAELAEATLEAMEGMRRKLASGVD